MSDRALAINLIGAAARAHLQPIGMRRQGRSRLWFSDEGWWLINVEFQPSHGNNVGTYLNVGAMWLWRERDFRSFDYGHRLHWRRDGTFADRPPIGEPGWRQFLGYVNADQFAFDVALVAEIAGARVDQLRAAFPDPCAAAHFLASQPAQPGEDQTWRTYDAGAAAALCGKAATARRMFSRVAAGALDPDWGPRKDAAGDSPGPTRARSAYAPTADKRNDQRSSQATRPAAGSVPHHRPSAAREILRQLMSAAVGCTAIGTAKTPDNGRLPP